MRTPPRHSRGPPTAAWPLRDLGIAVGIGGTPAYQDDVRSGSRRSGQSGVDPGVEHGQQRRVRAKRTAIPVGEPRMTHLFPRQRRRNITLPCPAAVRTSGTATTSHTEAAVPAAIRLM